MNKILLIFLAISLTTNLACSSKDNGSGNSNRDASNRGSMDMNRMNPNVANQNSSNQNTVNTNTNSANTNSTPVNPDQTMNMDMQSAPNASNAPYDLQFLDTMIAHHQSAIVMSKPAMEKASHAELRNLAQNIVNTQEKEISTMREWREQWFKGQPLALNMEAAGMADSMKSMDMKKLGTLNGNDFDLAFIEMMIAHHQGALSMSKEALEKAQHAELKTLAQSVIMTQETEIESMQNWKNAWSNQK